MSEVRAGSSRFELLPCPFCGEPPNLCKQRFVSYDGSIHRCYWHVIHRCRHGNYAETKLCGTKTEAIAAWNRRADAWARGPAKRTAKCVVASNSDTDHATGHYECGACGGAIDFWDKWCRHCGARLEEDA